MRPLTGLTASLRPPRHHLNAFKVYHLDDLPLSRFFSEEGFQGREHTSEYHAGRYAFRRLQVYRCMQRHPR